MKLKITLTISILLFSVNVFCQDENTTSVAIIDIDANVEVSILDRLDPGVKKTQSKYFKQNLEMISYDILKTCSSENNSFSVFENARLLDIVARDHQGVPNPIIPKTAIKKLLKAGLDSSPYIQLTTNWQSEGDVLGQQKLLTRVRPNFEVILKLFNASGKVIGKSSSRSVYPEFIEFHSFNKSNTQDIDRLIQLLASELPNSMNRALSRLTITK